MKNSFCGSGFAKMYVWISKAKHTMGVFYVAYVIVYLLLGLIGERETVTLDLFTAIEMISACFLIGVAQQVILPVNRLTKIRCVLWVCTSALITLAFSLGFGWFARFPLWGAAVFTAAMILGMVAMILSYYLQLLTQTRILNRRLEEFQKGGEQHAGHPH